VPAEKVGIGIGIRIGIGNGNGSGIGSQKTRSASREPRTGTKAAKLAAKTVVEKLAT